MTLNVELDEQQAQRLQGAARRLNVSVNDLAKAAINDLLARPDSDSERAATRVLKKNTELNKRLACCATSRLGKTSETFSFT